MVRSSLDHVRCCANPTTLALLFQLRGTRPHPCGTVSVRAKINTDIELAKETDIELAKATR